MPGCPSGSRSTSALWTLEHPDLCSEFPVSQDMCGFGAIPRLNESIHVTMKNRVQKRLFQGTEYQVKGVLHIKEEIEDDIVIGLTR